MSSSSGSSSRQSPSSSRQSPSSSRQSPSSSPRNYLDPWDIENYIYLRSGQARRRSVCFDTAVRFAQYDDEFGPIYGSMADLKGYSGDTYSSLPVHCPTCSSREYERIPYEEPIYEDVARFGVNTLGHLRIDYSTNWNKLDRYIGRA